MARFMSPPLTAAPLVPSAPGYPPSPATPILASARGFPPAYGATPPTPAPLGPMAWNRWSSGLCACTADFESMMLSACLPCVQFGLNMEKLKGTACYSPCLLVAILASIPFFGCCLVPFYTHNARLTLRHKYGIQEGPCNDCAVHFFCFCCALAQEARELSARGVSRLMPAVPSVMPYQNVRYWDSSSTYGYPGALSPEAARAWQAEGVMPTINTPCLQTPPPQ